MDVTRRRLLGAIGGGMAIAGCMGTDGGSNESPTTTDTGDGAMGTPTASPGGTTVQVRDHPELGEILVDSAGMTLYMFDSDTKGSGASTCYDGCESSWPPLTVDGEPTAGESVSAELTTFERDDGSMQVAAAGWPLYYFAPDQNPGDANGQGVQDVWWVLRPDGTPVKPDSTATSTQASSATIETREHSEHGEILVDAEGMTLYMFDADTKGSGASTCYDDCASNWPPLTVDGEPTAGMGVSADLTTFERDDGSMQVSANGWPLYYFASDQNPGDSTGQGVQDVWWVLAPDGTPVKPDSMTTPTSSSSGDDTPTPTDGGGFY